RQFAYGGITLKLQNIDYTALRWIEEHSFIPETKANGKPNTISVAGAGLGMVDGTNGPVSVTLRELQFFVVLRLKRRSFLPIVHPFGCRSGARAGRPRASQRLHRANV